jgi:glycosyltransferase involved in cell wall biosynthesis
MLSYMAVGLPTVAYDSPVAREILGTLGVFASPGDVAQLADAIEVLLDDPGRRAELGPKLRERVRREFTWDAAAARLVDIYAEAHARRRGRHRNPRRDL